MQDNIFRKRDLKLIIFKYFALIFVYFFIWIVLDEDDMDSLFKLNSPDHLLFFIIFVGGFIIYFITYYILSTIIKKRFDSDSHMIKGLDMYYPKSEPNKSEYLFFRNAARSDIKEVYYVSNKEGAIFYKIYLDKVLPNEYAIENYKKEKVGIIKTKILSSINTKCEVEINNGKKIHFKRDIKNGECIWDFNGNDCKIESNSVYTEYNKIIMNKKIIGNIDTNALDDSYLVGNYDLIIKDKDMELIIIALTMCILFTSNYYRSANND